MQHSYLLAGISTGKLMRLLARNGFSLHPKYFLSVLFLFQASVFASVFNRVEKYRMAPGLKKYKMPADPVFIIGHWRTGTTLLHQLMALDENLVTPNVFRVSAPDSFLVSEKYYRPVMSKAMPGTRPMDNVKLGFYEPQEDEYALIKLTLDSPLERLVFPKTNAYFLMDKYGFYPENLPRWEKAMRRFCLRLSYAGGKRVLLKNPFHSLRIPLLLKMFPNARFIHIHRHPYEVVPSTMHMWHVVGSQNKLKRKAVKPTVSEVATVLNKVLIGINEQFGKMPEKSRIEIGYKELENDPLETMRKVYRHLELPFSDAFKTRLEEQLPAMKKYRKNSYVFSDTEKETIKNILQKQFIHYHYNG